MKRYRVRLTPEADGHLNAIDRWWHLHRREHPDLVREEIAEASRMLASFPEAGEAHRSRRQRGLRRLFLPRSRYFLVYTVDHLADEVQIVAIWHASRSKGPPLK
jgi:plasmid stabilization system protein ParE